MSKQCLICGKQLADRQTKYCSRECFHQSMRSEVKYIKCEYCGKEFKFNPSAPKKRFCSKSCANTTNKGRRIDPEDANRPFTSETKYLIRLWYKQGDSKERIAEALGRSLENIEQAFM